MTNLPHQLPEEAVELLANLREHLHSHPPLYDFYLVLSETSYEFHFFEEEIVKGFYIKRTYSWLQSRIFESLLNNSSSINQIMDVRHLISPIGAFMVKRNSGIRLNLKSECMREIIESYFVTKHIESCIKPYKSSKYVYILTLCSNFTENQEDVADIHKYKTNIEDKELILDVYESRAYEPSSLNGIAVSIIDPSQSKSGDFDIIKSNFITSYVTKDADEVIHIISDFIFKNNSYLLFNPFNNIWKDPVLSLEYYDEIKQLLGIMVGNFGEDDKKNFLFTNKILPQNISSKIRLKANDDILKTSSFLDDTKLKFYYDYINQTKNNADVISPKIFILE